MSRGDPAGADHPLVIDLLALAGRSTVDLFDVGDRLILLHDDHGYSFRRLAGLAEQSQARVHAAYATARDFPPEDRTRTPSFSVYERAGACARRFKLDPPAALAELREHGTTQRRAVPPEGLPRRAEGGRAGERQAAGLGPAPRHAAVREVE